MKRKRKLKILEYTCRSSGEQHISHLYADCSDQYPNRGPKRILPRKEGPDRIVSPSIRRDPPAPPPYYGVCSFCGSAGHGHELCPKLKEAMREQAEQIA